MVYFKVQKYLPNKVRNTGKKTESNEVENIRVIHLRYVYLFRIESNIINFI